MNLKEKVGYGLGDAASSMFWKLFGMYLMFFYTDIFGIGAGVVGTMFLITRVWDSFFDIMVGVVSDRTQTKWGKFRPYILYMAVPFAVIGAFTFFTPDFGTTGKIVYAYLTYSLMMMVYSAINVPYASLLGVMSPFPKERNILSTFRMTFAYLGSFVTLLLFMPLVNHFSHNSMVIKDQQQGWFMAVAVIAIISASLFLCCFALTRERVSPKAASSFKDDLKSLGQNKPWWILLGAGISALIFNSIRDGATIYYFKYYVDENTFGHINVFNVPFVLSGLYLAVGQAANILGVILAAPVSNWIGKRRTYLAAMILATVLSIGFYWLDNTDLIAIFVLQALISICAGSIFPILWSMYADCADYSEYKTGNRSTGLIFSSSSMGQKLGWAIGTAMTGWLLAYFGFEANKVQSAEMIVGIKMFLSIFPAIGTLLSIAFIYFYPLSDTLLQTVTDTLNKRRETNA